MEEGHEPSFEEALATLEGLIERIESSDVGLEEAIERYEEGAELVKRCRAILDRAQVRVAELTASGVEVEEPTPLKHSAIQEELQP